MKRKVIGGVAAFVLILLITYMVIGYRLSTYVRTNLSTYSSVPQAQAALRQNPNDAQAHRTLAQNYFQRKEYTASASEWESVVKLQPDNRSAKSYLAAAFIQAGQKQQAVSILTDLSQQDDAYGRNAKRTLRHVLSKNPPGRIQPSS